MSTATLRLQVETGKYCRVVTDTTDGNDKIICDQDTPATATQLIYTGVPLLQGAAAVQQRLA